MNGKKTIKFKNAYLDENPPVSPISNLTFLIKILPPGHARIFIEPLNNNLKNNLKGLF